VGLYAAVLGIIFIKLNVSVTPETFLTEQLRGGFVDVMA
jgi:hypothetical protein